MKNLGVIGYGWLASKFAKLYGDMYKIFVTTTSQEKYNILQHEGCTPTLINFESSHFHFSEWEVLPKLDAVLISVPLSVRYDYLENVKHKIENILRFLGDFKKQIILISSTGIYPTEPGFYCENDYAPGKVITERCFSYKFPQTTILRCGGLMGDDRYISRYQIIQDLNQTVNYVHFADVAKVIDMILRLNIDGELLNVVAPKHPTKKEVLEYEINKTIFQEPNPKERIVSSEKLISKYGFEFEHTDPKLFKTET